MKLLSKKKIIKTLIEVPTSSHLANRKWSCYLGNWDSSGENNHLHVLYFLSHLKQSPEKKVLQMHNDFCILFILAWVAILH